jgi:hypothetical protein
MSLNIFHLENLYGLKVTDLTKWTIKSIYNGHYKNGSYGNMSECVNWINWLAAASRSGLSEHCNEHSGCVKQKWAF